MQCSKCGAQFEGDGTFCPNCRPAVRVLSPEERENFRGITIEDTDFRNDREQEYSDTGRRVYVKHIQLGTGNLLQRIILGLVIAGLIVVALPFMMFILGAALLGWMLTRLFRW